MQWAQNVSPSILMTLVLGTVQIALKLNEIQTGSHHTWWGARMSLQMLDPEINFANFFLNNA